MKNFPTWMGMPSKIQMGSLTDPSAICNEILVGFKSPIPNLSKTDLGIRLTLAHRSHNVFLNLIFSKEQGMVKLLGSLSFGGKLFKITISTSLRPLFLYMISFKYLT
jgi:hypothetical protein